MPTAAPLLHKQGEVECIAPIFDCISHRILIGIVRHGQEHPIVSVHLGAACHGAVDGIQPGCCSFAVCKSKCFVAAVHIYGEGAFAFGVHVNHHVRIETTAVIGRHFAGSFVHIHTAVPGAVPLLLQLAGGACAGRKLGVCARTVSRGGTSGIIALFFKGEINAHIHQVGECQHTPFNGAGAIYAAARNGQGAIFAAPLAIGSITVHRKHALAIILELKRYAVCENIGNRHIHAPHGGCGCVPNADIGVVGCLGRVSLSTEHEDEHNCENDCKRCAADDEERLFVQGLFLLGRFGCRGAGGLCGGILLHRRSIALLCRRSIALLRGRSIALLRGRSVALLSRLIGALHRSALLRRGFGLTLRFLCGFGGLELSAATGTEFASIRKLRAAIRTKSHIKCSSLHFVLNDCDSLCYENRICGFQHFVFGEIIACACMPEAEALTLMRLLFYGHVPFHLICR